MDFSLTDTQTEQRQAMIRFAEQHLGEDVQQQDSPAHFDRALWQRCAEAGILAQGVPVEFGGRGEQDVLSVVIAMEGLGYGSVDNGLPFALNTHVWTVQHPILNYGDDAQKARYLPSMCAGDLIGAHAMTEPAAGSDSAAIQTAAVPVEGGYRLTGRKCMISLAPVADLLVLFASTRPAAGKWGITAFLVDRHVPGVSVSEPVGKMGLRTVPMGEIVLEDCFVPSANRLGPEGAGAAIANHSLEYERCCILASQVGRMQRQLEVAISAARQRHQFGRAIGRFQSVSNRIADMKLRLETTRLLLYKVAWMKSQGQSTVLESAMLKLYASEQFLASGIDAMRIHGGRGYLVDNGVEHDVRDALGGVLYAGTSDIQRNIIAGMLGLDTDV